MTSRASQWMALLAAGGTAFLLSSAAAAEEPLWQVARASGDVWVIGTGLERASLDTTTTLKSGDEIRTGRSGRVLLTRGEETILISPNSVVAVPAEKANEAETVILQKAGEIVLKVEKKHAPHFEVQTPFLAALVKGTQFRVTVDGTGSKVDVLEGRVQVSDYKSGQFALVLPGQTAKVAPAQRGGLTLSGAGSLGPIQHGTPSAPGIGRVPVPRNGLAAPKSADSGHSVRAIGNNAPKGQQDAAARQRNGVIRVATAMGDVRIDVNKATKSFARSGNAVANGKSRGAGATVWNSDALSDGNGASKSYGKGNSGTKNGNSSNGKGNGKGNSASAHAANEGGNGNGNAYGHGNGNGNGKGKGKGKGNS